MHGHNPVDDISTREVEVQVYGNGLDSLQGRSMLKWAITGATVGSKVLPNDHSLNYVGSHIL